MLGGRRYVTKESGDSDMHDETNEVPDRIIHGEDQRPQRHTLACFRNNLCSLIFRLLEDGEFRSAAAAHVCYALRQEIGIKNEQKPLLSLKYQTKKDFMMFKRTSISSAHYFELSPEGHLARACDSRLSQPLVTSRLSNSICTPQSNRA